MAVMQCPFAPRTWPLAAALIACCALLVLPGIAAADDDLTRDLLGDLESDLLKDLEKPQAKSAKDDKATSNPAGEDLGAPSEQDNPLVKIMERMRRIEQRIAETDAAAGTQRIQTDVLTDLSSLIRLLQSQQSQRKRGGKPSGDAKAGDTAAGKPSDKPSADSTDRLDKATNKKADRLAPDQLVKEVWGHLPPQVVEQMTRQSIDKFLPKYEQLIEDYFRRLAESSADE